MDASSDNNISIESPAGKNTNAEDEKKTSPSAVVETTTGAAAPRLSNRFELALLEQQRKEEERLQALRANTKTPKAVGKIGARWEQTLSSSKESGQERLVTRRRQSMIHYSITEGSGLVKRLIGEFEELFMQLMASNERINAVIRSAYTRHSTLSPSEQSVSLDPNSNSVDFPEKFVMGSTHIYDVKTLAEEIGQNVAKLLQENSGKPVYLPCGVYGAQNKAPPIDIVVIALYIDSDLLLAISIECTLENYLNPLAFGVKKLEVFPPKSGEALFTRVLDIVPKEGWQLWEAMVKGQVAATSVDTVVCSTDTTDDTDECTARLCEFNAPDKDAHDVNSIFSSSSSNETEINPSPPRPNEISIEHPHLTFLSPSPPLTIQSEENNSVRSSAENNHVDSNDSGTVFAEVCEVIVTLSEPPSKANTSSITEIEAEEVTNLKIETKVASETPEESPQELETVSINEEMESASAISFTGEGGERRFEEEDNEEGAKEGIENILDDDEEESDEDAQAVAEDQDRTDNGVENDGGGELREDEKSPVINTLLAEVRSKEIFPGEDEDKGSDWSAPYPWEIADEEVDDLPLVSAAEIRGIHVNEVSTASSSQNSLIMTRRLRDIRLTIATAAAAVASAPQAGFFRRTFLGTAANAASESDQLDEYSIASQGGSFMATGTLRYHNISSMNFSPDGKKVFEWLRGAATSGWVIKWPINGKRGFAQKRYLVLRDNIICYFRAPPMELLLPGSDNRPFLDRWRENIVDEIILTENSTIIRARKSLRQCLKVTTPKQSMFFRCFSVTEHTRWLIQVKLAIRNLAWRAVFRTKGRVKCVWQHESPQFSCIAVDALAMPSEPTTLPGTVISTPVKSSDPTSAGSTTSPSSPSSPSPLPMNSAPSQTLYAHASLFQFLYSERYLADMQRQVLESSSTSKRGSMSMGSDPLTSRDSIVRESMIRETMDSPVEEPDSISSLPERKSILLYSLDFFSGKGDRLKTELILPAAQIEEESLGLTEPTELRVLRILSSKAVLIGGTNGHLSVANIGGLTTSLPQAETPEADPENPSTRTGCPLARCLRNNIDEIHHSSSTLLSLATHCIHGDTAVFAAGDSFGVVSLWYLSASGSVVYLDSINVRALDPRKQSITDPSTADAINTINPVFSTQTVDNDGVKESGSDCNEDESQQEGEFLSSDLTLTKTFEGSGGKKGPTVSERRSGRKRRPSLDMDGSHYSDRWEKVSSLNFSPCGRYLFVGTCSRLLLMSLELASLQKTDGVHPLPSGTCKGEVLLTRFSGWTLMDGTQSQRPTDASSAGSIREVRIYSVHMETLNSTSSDGADLHSTSTPTSTTIPFLSITPSKKLESTAIPSSTEADGSPTTTSASTISDASNVNSDLASPLTPATANTSTTSNENDDSSEVTLLEGENSPSTESTMLKVQPFVSASRPSVVEFSRASAIDGTSHANSETIQLVMWKLTSKDVSGSETLQRSTSSETLKSPLYDETNISNSQGGSIFRGLMSAFGRGKQQKDSGHATERSKSSHLDETSSVLHRVAWTKEDFRNILLQLMPL